MRVDELTGATIGRYRIGGRLQALPYATVHRATFGPQAEQVLIWTFQDPYASAAGFIEALQRFAADRRAAQVDGLLSVRDLGLEELRSPLAYLVTENAPQGFLLSLLQAGRAPGVFALTGPLAQTVDRLHQLGMVHGDIQPSTVALGARGPVLAGHSIRTVVSRVTPAAAWIGVTQAFRPPEAPSSTEPSATADLWGLSALVYYLLVGRAPALNGGLIPPSRIRPQLSPRIDQVLLRALATNPEKRFRSAGEFFAALRGRPAPERPRAFAVPGPEAEATRPAPTPRIPAPAPLPSFPEVDSPPTPVPAISPGTTPASIRAEALPGEGPGAPGQRQSNTQLIPVEPFGVRPTARRRGGIVLLTVLVLVVLALLLLALLGRVRF